MSNELQRAMEMVGNTKGIDIHGKNYATVAQRVVIARQCFGTNLVIDTKVISVDSDTVVVGARVGLLMPNVGGEQYVNWLATGHAEEKRTSSQINKTSALENCETSAIGRALAGLGICGSEYASANEVENAIHQQRTGDEPDLKPRPVPPRKPPVSKDPPVVGPPTPVKPSIPAAAEEPLFENDSDEDIPNMMETADWQNLTCGYGKNKGVRYADMNDKQILWYYENAVKSTEDKKSKYYGENVLQAHALAMHLKSRGMALPVQIPKLEKP